MATANDDDRSTLDQILSNILGFEDGVSGIVEHLLAIETNEVGAWSSFVRPFTKHRVMVRVVDKTLCYRLPAFRES